MKSKPITSYRIPFRGEGIAFCCFLMALSIFARFLYYFMPCDFSQWNIGVWILQIILPTVISGAFCVLLRIVKLRSPGVYGILAAVICLLLLGYDLMEGGIVQIILSILLLPVLGVLLLKICGGHISVRSVAGLLLILVFLIRLIIGLANKAEFAYIISELSVLASLFCYIMSLKGAK